MRRATDRRVREVMAIFDAHVASVRPSPELLDGFMVVVADTGVDRFRVPAVWSPPAIRSVLLSLLVNAPERDLRDMLRKARSEFGFLAETSAGRDNVADMAKDVRLQLRLSAEEHAAWVEAAGHAKLKLSEWIRRRCNGKHVIQAPVAASVKPARKPAR